MLALILSIIIYFIYSTKSKEHFANDTFDKVYENKIWGNGEILGGSSGPGSDPKLNKKYIQYLNDFIQQNNIKSIVDLGCGDWQIMRLINLNNIQYYGYDTSKIIINNNNKKYKKENIHFIHNDLDQEVNLKNADLLICKDVLQHLSYNNINKILSQLDKFKYVFIIGNMQENTINEDIQDGGCRDLDIRKHPFNIKNTQHPKRLWTPERSDIALLEIKSN